MRFCATLIYRTDDRSSLNTIVRMQDDTFTVLIHLLTIITKHIQSL